MWNEASKVSTINSIGGNASCESTGTGPRDLGSMTKSKKELLISQNTAK